MALMKYGQLFLIGLIVCHGSSVEFDQVSFDRRVTDFVQAGLKCHNNPALSLSVVKDGKNVLAKGFGHKTLDKLEEVTNRTLFGIASLSKAFAATLILKQIEENDSLSLSTQIRDLLGRDDIFKDSLRSRYTTLEDLLAHRMGFPGNNQIRLDKTLSRRSLVDRLKFLSAKGGFRTSFYYSNLMYGLLTYISEVIDGKSWEDLVKQKLFDPLDMTSSTFVTTADPEHLDLAVGYQDRYGKLEPVPFEFSRHWGTLCGSGCILSNALDMANWMMFHLNNGRNDKNDRVLDTDILNDAHSAQNSISYSSVEKYYTRPLTPVTLSHSNYGLGWRLGHYRGFPIIVHTGSTYGYRAMITLIPGIQAGVFTALTGDDPNFLFRTNIHLYIADLLLKQEPWLDNRTICSFPEPWQQKPDSTSDRKPRTDIKADRPLFEYEGAYSNKAYGLMDIYKNSSAGYLMAKVGIGKFILYPKSTADEFYAQGIELMENVRDFSSLQFSFNNGKVQSITIPSMESKDPPVFYRTQKNESNATERTKRSSASCATTHMVSVIFALLFASLQFVRELT